MARIPSPKGQERIGRFAADVLARRFRLPEPETRDVHVERDLEVPMDDGVVLLADRYVPRDLGPRPTVLVRSPYGRRGFFGMLHGRLLAERGFQTVVQSVRGTFGSGGAFSPFDERADGLATLAWLERQPWYQGPLGMTGSSYLGLTQWAVAADAGDRLGAITPSITASQFHGQAYGGGSIALDTAMSWLVIVSAQEGRLGPLRVVRGLRRVPELLDLLPINDLDEAVVGRRLPFFAEWVQNPDAEDEYWTARDFSRGVADVTAPVQLVGGWYDIFLPWLLDDFATLQRAGRKPQLIVGPWAHTSPGQVATGTREAIAWLRAHLLGDRRMLRDAAVRIYVTGAREWRELETWPPPGSVSRRLWLGGGGRLGEAEPAPAGEAAPDGEPAREAAPAGEAASAGEPAPAEEPAAGDSAPDRYRYDPARPTPALGGPVLLQRDPVVDNRPLEARSDVLVYTADPLTTDTEAIGPVSVELYVRSSLEFFDVFARVCDVAPDGESRNVCDALARVTPDRFDHLPDGSVRVAFDLWPTAHRFAAGHRVRLQVSSGAHPRYARNPGTGEDAATASRLLVADQEVLHDAEHPSSLTLSVMETSSSPG